MIRRTWPASSFSSSRRNLVEAIAAVGGIWHLISSSIKNLGLNPDFGFSHTDFILD